MCIDYYTFEKGSCGEHGKMKDLWDNGAPGVVPGDVHAEDMFITATVKAIADYGANATRRAAHPLFLNYNMHVVSRCAVV